MRGWVLAELVDFSQRLRVETISHLRIEEGGGTRRPEMRLHFWGGAPFAGAL